MVCDACTVREHEPAECRDRGEPMCRRACTCRCERPEKDPAPYWSSVALAGLVG